MAYKQVKISVSPGLAEAFKAACVAANEPMASVLAKHMAEYSQARTCAGPAPGLATRRQRRAALKRLIVQLESIKAAEGRYRDNIPDSLLGSAVYDRAEETISAMEEAAELLASAY